MPPRKRKPAKAAKPETPAGALTTDAGGRPLIDPETGLPIVAGQEVASDDDA